MKAYKLIILDFDGTLCATHQAILFCINKAYQKLGFPAPSRDFADTTIRAGLGMENSLKTLSPGLNASQLKKLQDTYEEIYLEEGEQKSAPFSKVNEVLAKLHQAGYILTVVSNKALASVKVALERFDLKKYISVIVGDVPNLKKKPDPMAYTNYIQPQFKTIQGFEILMVGDTPADLLFAKAIGADSCWAEYGYGDEKSCRALNPNYILQHFTDLLKILLS